MKLNLKYSPNRFVATPAPEPEDKVAPAPNTEAKVKSAPKKVAKKTEVADK